MPEFEKLPGQRKSHKLGFWVHMWCVFFLSVSILFALVLFPSLVFPVFCRYAECTGQYKLEAPAPRKRRLEVEGQPGTIMPVRHVCTMHVCTMHVHACACMPDACACICDACACMH